MIDDAAVRARAGTALRELGVDLPLDVAVSHLSVGQQQSVEIAKALGRAARIIVMDEPTAALSDREIERLFAIIGRLREAKTGIIYISHRMEELARIADRVTVMRDGRVVETRKASDFPPDEIVAAMVGRRLESHFPQIPELPAGAPVRLDVRGLLRPPAVNGVSFAVRAGEIVGLAGLIGAGRTETVRMIAGADVPRSGEVSVDGKIISPGRIGEAIEAGVAFITEDRKTQGLVLGMAVRENVTLAHLADFVDRDLSDRRSAREGGDGANDRRASDSNAGHRAVGSQSLRRDAAEGGLGEMAARERPRLSLRRADARDRRRGEGGDLSRSCAIWRRAERRS